MWSPPLPAPESRLESMWWSPSAHPFWTSGVVIGHESNVSFVDEALTRLTAQRAYEANLVSLQAQLDTADELLDVVG